MSLLAQYLKDATGTTLLDTSGSGNHGTISGITMDQPGIQPGVLGSSALFDGVNDIAAITDETDFDILSTDGLSIFVTIKPNVPTTDFAIFSLFSKLLGSGTNAGFEYNIMFTAELLVPNLVVIPFAYVVSDLGGDNYIQRSGGVASALANGTIYRMGMTYDGTKTVAGLKFWINGTEVASYANSHDTLTGQITNNAIPTIGNRPGGSQFYKGQMQDMRIEKRAWSSTEILADFNNYSTVRPSPPIATSTENSTGVIVTVQAASVAGTAAVASYKLTENGVDVETITPSVFPASFAARRGATLGSVKIFNVYAVDANGALSITSIPLVSVSGPVSRNSYLAGLLRTL